MGIRYSTDEDLSASSEIGHIARKSADGAVLRAARRVRHGSRLVISELRRCPTAVSANHESARPVRAAARKKEAGEKDVPVEPETTGIAGVAGDARLGGSVASARPRCTWRRSASFLAGGLLREGCS